MQPKQIYEPRKNEMMKVAVFFSGGASSFKAMLDDTDYGELYEVTVGVTNNEDASGIKIFDKKGIPVVHHPLNFRAFDVEAAKPMYEQVLERISEYNPDLIAMSGFMRILTYPVIEQGSEKGEYSGRVLNVHPAPLNILHGPGIERFDATGLLPSEMKNIKKYNKLERKYKGKDAVYDAILSGEKETRSTVHMATEDFDEGPIVVQSRPFKIDQDKIREWRTVYTDHEKIRDYADRLQEEMKIDGDGAAYTEAMREISEGSIYITTDGNLIWELTTPLRYQGIRL